MESGRLPCFSSATPPFFPQTVCVSVSVCVYEWYVYCVSVCEFVCVCVSVYECVCLCECV